VNGKVSIKGGTKNPPLTVYLRSFCANNGIGTRIGILSRTTRGGKLVAQSLPETSLAIDCTSTFRVTGLKVIKGATYTVSVDANTVNGDTARRTITVVGV
jgi:hypothetical protein